MINQSSHPNQTFNPGYIAKMNPNEDNEPTFS